MYGRSENTYLLFKKFNKQIEKEPILYNVYKNLDVPFVLVLMDMERRGIYLDIDYLREIGKKVENEIVEIGTSLFSEGWKEVRYKFSKTSRRSSYKSWSKSPKNGSWECFDLSRRS